ncbi:hypothetical protein GUJ93_ZPchr0003g18412 [Zizania palustris]|uniref:Protein kinase domain-containing protein n=1 Tax=Zizania palustris TaxID=103762 RepID=A0A8J5SRC7_ZIZPA|nr:hypothetical protein GUJ93_ZPchr0003g18412 [Zizania palustris]
MGGKKKAWAAEKNARMLCSDALVEAFHSPSPFRPVNPHAHQLKLCDFGSAKVLVLGTTTREEIKHMNPNYTEFKFPQIKDHPWHKTFHKRMPSEDVDLVSQLLQYSPNLRCNADPNVRLPNGCTLPQLFNFKPRAERSINGIYYEV